MSASVAVIGGGISGLAAANRLRECAPSLKVHLLEASQWLGGVLKTRQQDGFLLEAAADNFLTTPSSAVDLCRRLNLEHELLSPDASRRQAFVVHQGELQPIPAGFLVMAPSRLWPLAATSILSWRGKLRAGLEYFLPRRTSAEDESLQSFVCRRFGRELFERLVQPLVGGIYTADPKKLSLHATMPRFCEMEREHGSLIRAMMQARRAKPGPPSEQESSGVRYGQFAALQGGMSSLVNAIAQQLPADSIHLDSPVRGLCRSGENRWLVAVGGNHPRSLIVDGVILATPATHTAKLLSEMDQPLAEEFQEIDYASCAVVSLGYRRKQIGNALNGFGFVVPLIENRLILSCSYSSVKYAGRAPDDCVLLRVFIGGACQSGLLQLPKSQLVELARREVTSLLRISGEPILQHIVRQSRAMPQYQVGHCERVERIESRMEQFPSMALASNSLHGVGVPACIAGGESAAEQLAQRVQSIHQVYSKPAYT